MRRTESKSSTVCCWLCLLVCAGSVLILVLLTIVLQVSSEATLLQSATSALEECWPTSWPESQHVFILLFQIYETSVNHTISIYTTVSKTKRIHQEREIKLFSLFVWHVFFMKISVYLWILKVKFNFKTGTLRDNLANIETYFKNIFIFKSFDTEPRSVHWSKKKIKLKKKFFF